MTRSDGISNESGSSGGANISAIGMNGDATNASSVIDIIDSGVPITVAINGDAAEVFGGFLSYLQKGRLHPALRL